VTSFNSAAEPDTRGNNRSETKGPENTGHSIDWRDPREQKHRHEKVSQGRTDQRRGLEYTREEHARPTADHQSITQ
jgi:hypothetical protein